VRIAQQLMSVSRWVEERRITAAQMKLLPPDYNTITLLTRVDELTFKEMVEEGTIRPSLQRDEVAKLLRLRHRQGDEQRVLNLTPVVGKFRTLVIDPAWEYDDDLAGIIRPDYALQGLDNLRALDVGAWVDEQEGCHLYCWATNAFIIEAGKLVAHWGFTHRTVLTWVKPSIGVGRYFRNDTEHVLFATWGDTGTRPAAMSIGTHFEAPRGEHSEKPAAFYDIVRAASFPPYGEANQREPREDFVNLFEEREQQAAAE
jgi:N6-adenosine-specific RNA methylase IME4